MKTYRDVMAAHQALLARYEQGAQDAEFLDAVRAYIEAARQASAEIADPRERDQVRANLRFWASVVFERTGVYPDTALLPAREPAQLPPGGGARGLDSAAPSAAPMGWLWPVVVVVGLLAILSIGSLAAQALRPAPASSTPVVTPGSVTTFTPTPEVTPGAGATFTPTPGSTGTLTPTPVPPTRTPTPRPTPTPELVSQLRVERITFGEPSCGTRSLYVGLPTDVSLKFAQLTLMRTDLEGILQTFDVGKLQNAEIKLDLTKNDYGYDSTKGTSGLLETTYLVSVALPKMPVVQALVPFTTDCQRNATEVYFSYTRVPLLVKDPPQDPELQLFWTVRAWGPTPDQEHWVAELQLMAEGGGGAYLFWLDGEPLPGDTVMLKTKRCQPAHHVLAVTAGGRLTVREFFLYAPCP